MFNVSCAHCGATHQQDEARVPPSGIVIKCPQCSRAIIVMPPKTADLAASRGRGDATEMGLGDGRPPAPPKKGPLGPALAAFDAESDIDLPAPKRKELDIVDLPAPRGARGGRATAPAPADDDLLAPVGPAPSARGAVPAPGAISLDEPDLLAPVGPTSMRGGAFADAPDLLAPVGPVSTKGGLDLPAPVGPHPTRGGLDLPTPVGPTPTRGGLDLPTPVGPKPTKGGVDLPTPVGPTPTRGSLDLPTPVGPHPTRGLDLPTPVGPKPTKGVDLPAPKGFFDDIPAPRTGAGPRPPAAAAVPSLDLDDLDVVPAGAPGPGIDLAPAHDPPPSAFAPPPSAFAPPPAAGGAPPFSMDSLDLLPAGSSESSQPSINPDAGPSSAGSPFAGSPGGMGFGELDLGGDASMSPLPDEPSQPHEASPVVSFGKPSSAGAAAAARGEAAPVARAPAADDALDTGPQKAKSGTVADDLVPEDKRARGRVAADGKPAKPALTPAQLRKRRIIGGAVLGVLLIGGGGAYTYTQVEAKVLGVKTIPYKARETKVKQGLLATRKYFASDEPGHWDRAVQEAEKVVAIDAKNGDALGLLAQAHIAAAIDEGMNTRVHTEAADEAIANASKRGATSPEIEKALALRELLDGGQPANARAKLQQLAQKYRGDADIPLYQGWVTLAAGDFQAAKLSFEGALSRAPQRMPAMYGLGRALAGLGENDKAKAEFEKVLSKRPDRKHFGAWLGLTEMIPRDRAGTREKELGIMVERAPERETAHPRDLSRAWALYGDEALAANNVDKAAERYRKAADIDNANVDAMVGIAVTSLLQGKKEDARGRLNNVAALAPAHVGMLLGQTRLALLDVKTAEAFGHVSKAAQVAPKRAEVHLWMGHVLVADPSQAAPGSAEASYREAIRLAPEDYQAYVALARLLSRTPGRESDAVALLSPVEKAAETDSVLANTLGEAYLSVKDTVTAEKWFRKALATDAGNAQARSNLGAALEAAGNLAAATVEYEAAYKLSQSEEISLRLAVAYEKQKRADDARRVYEGLLSTENGRVPSVTARAAAGRFFARRNDHAAAKEQGNAILIVDPQYPAGLFLRGFGALAEGKYNDAQKDINDAIQVDPQAQYWDGLGRVLERQNQLSEALGAYERAASTDPTYVAPRLGRARIRMVRAEYAKALGELTEAVKLEPENAEIWARIGESHYNLRELAKAEKAFAEALKRDGKRPDVLFMLARALDEDPRGSTSAVIGNMRQAIALAPEDADWLAEAYRILGFAQKKSGDKGGACASLGRYLDLADPRDGMREEAKRATLSCQ